VVAKIMLDRAAIKRLIEPEEVAELVAYLCSPAADFITGASIPLDGGWTAH
jgi:3-hydroxybutyrate dehydrogenase